MPSIADWRRRELTSKLTALPEELKNWRNMSEAGQPYEKHQSQIRRLAAQISGLHATVGDAFKDFADDEAMLRGGRLIENRILAVHSVWDYFRSKLVLRAQEPFGSFLRSADAFAWACYQPIQQQYGKAGGDDRREPPLVALQNMWSPSALPRDHAYAIARAPGGWTDTAPFVTIIESLPVPILGLPWFHLEHLPHIVLLAHEVGHVVEHDFGLEAANIKVVANAPIADETRRAAWLAWREELFADFFACYAAGPTFVWALAEALATGIKGVTTESKQDAPWGEYPTAALRVFFNLVALDMLGYGQDAATIRTAWNTTYEAHGMKAFEPDCRAIIDTWLVTTILPASLSYAAVAAQQVKATGLLEAGWALNPQNTRDPRALIAAASDYYRAHTETALVRDRWASVRNTIVKARKPGVLEGPGGAAAVKEIGDDVDRQRGRALAGAFFDALEKDRADADADA